MSEEPSDQRPVSDLKEKLRQEARRQRDRLAKVADPDTFKGFSEAVLSVLEARDGSETVAAYWPRGSEADIRVLMSDLQRVGHPIALPRVVEDEGPLEFRLFESGDPLSPGPFDVRQPAPEAPLVRPHILLVPLLAFDASGYRLGYGVGYYDRTLAALRKDHKILAIGIAYAGQMIDKVPREAHDEPLDLIATEEGVRVPKRLSGNDNPGKEQGAS